MTDDNKTPADPENADQAAPDAQAAGATAYDASAAPTYQGGSPYTDAPAVDFGSAPAAEAPAADAPAVDFGSAPAADAPAWESHRPWVPPDLKACPE